MSRTFVQLGTVAEFINGVAFKPEDWGDSGTRIIRIQNLTDPTKPFNRTERIVSKKLCVLPGDLLVSWSATLGVFEWPGPDIAVLNQHIFRVLPDEQKTEKHYLRYALEGAIAEMQRHLHGATMQHVNREEFLSTQIFFPPLSEQRRIADILDKADALRGKRRAALAQLDILAQSIFLDLFGDPFTNPKCFTIEQFVNICERIFKGAFSLKASSYLDEGIPFIRIADIQQNTIDLTHAVYIDERTHLQYRSTELVSSDIVFSKVGTIDRIAMIPDEIPRCNISQNNVGAKLRKSVIDPHYALAFLTTPHALGKIRSGSKKAVQDKLVLEDLRKLAIMLPPIPLQQEFAEVVAGVEKLKTLYRSSLAHMDALFGSLQHRAFRGEL